MSRPGPVLVIAPANRPGLGAALGASGLFPVIEASWEEAVDALVRLQPSAVVADASQDFDGDLDALAAQVALLSPYVPLVAVSPATVLSDTALPFLAGDPVADESALNQLTLRLKAALRVRALHETSLRMARHDSAQPATEVSANPPGISVLLVGRGASYPALSVALGESATVVGTFSVEAAAGHLNARDLDGIVIGDGFEPRVITAFLTVLAEDPRFRNLPVILSSAAGLTPGLEMPNLEIVPAGPTAIAASAFPFLRQHALELHLRRKIEACDSSGRLDARTGLLTPAAFAAEFPAALAEAHAHGRGLSIARLAFDPQRGRLRRDAARILSRLLRRADIAAPDSEGGLLVAMSGVAPREAQAMAKRLARVLKHTVLEAGQSTPIEPLVAIVAASPGDTAADLLARLRHSGARAAS